MIPPHVLTCIYFFLAEGRWREQGSTQGGGQAQVHTRAALCWREETVKTAQVSDRLLSEQCELKSIPRGATRN